MTAIATVPQITSAPSFSFYVGSRSEQLIKTVAEHADAVTIRGARGPAAISRLRGSGFDAAVLFDREDWKSDPPGQVDLRSGSTHRPPQARTGSSPPAPSSHGTPRTPTRGLPSPAARSSAPSATTRPPSSRSTPAGSARTLSR